MILALFEHPGGVETLRGPHLIYDLERGTAHFGAARVDGPAVTWCLARDGEALVARCHKNSSRPALQGEVGLDHESSRWLVRCDRVEFPPGGVAYRHVHPGPGIRRLLHGELSIDSPDGVRTYRPGDAWFEGAHHPVLATASATEDTAFVRALLLPSEWAGKRTIRYLDQADEDKPKLQRATVLLEESLAP